VCLTLPRSHTSTTSRREREVAQPECQHCLNLVGLVQTPPRAATTTRAYMLAPSATCVRAANGG
jgi:hypothetical protein